MKKVIAKKHRDSIASSVFAIVIVTLFILTIATTVTIVEKQDYRDAIELYPILGEPKDPTITIIVTWIVCSIITMALDIFSIVSLYIQYTAPDEAIYYDKETEKFSFFYKGYDIDAKKSEITDITYSEDTLLFGLPWLVVHKKQNYGHIKFYCSDSENIIKVKLYVDDVRLVYQVMNHIIDGDLLNDIL